MTKNRHTKPATSNKHIISLLCLITLLLALLIPAASALSITAPGTYTLSGDQTTLTITGTTGTYTINGAGYSVSGSTTITAPAGQTLTVIINDANLQTITGTGSDGTAGSNGANGAAGTSSSTSGGTGQPGNSGINGGSIYLTLTNSTATTVSLVGGDGGNGGNGGTGGRATHSSGSIGRGGNGGTGGDGGTGGSVQIQTANTTISGDVNLITGSGGIGGNGGTGGIGGGYHGKYTGNSGSGGVGGQGGNSGEIVVTILDSTIGNVITSTPNGNNGGTGGNGVRGSYNSAGNSGGGGSGGNSGSVTITVDNGTVGTITVTNGNGGNAGDGAAGVGGDSTNGYSGGDGGNGGNGGNAGNINIQTTSANIGTISLTNGNGGNAGDGAAGGYYRGNGGNGGNGGSNGQITISLTSSRSGPIGYTGGNGGNGGTGGAAGYQGYAGAAGTLGTLKPINPASTITGSTLSTTTGNLITITSSNPIPTITATTLENTNPSGYLIYHGSSVTGSATITNNILSIARSNGALTNSPSSYTLYQTPASGTNIVGGTQTGGNYWTNPTHTGYSDDYSISAGYIGTTFAPAYNNDQYPLIKPLNLGQLNQTPAPTTQKTPDIGGTTSNTSYNVIQQYTLTTSPLDIHYTGATDAIVPAANAVYLLYGNNQTLTPTTTTTGSTLTQTYITKNHTLAANTNGQIIIYPNTPGTQEPQIIAQTDQQITALALSPTLITYTINNAKTYILDRTTYKNLATYTTTAATTYAAANQQTDTITIFTGTTFTICHKGDDGTLDTQTFTPVSSPNGKITGIWENYDTNTILITTTTSGTYLYTTTSTGTTVTATQTSKSTETNPLTNIHNTQANTYIASNNNKLYIIDAAGTTIGTYTAGSQIEATGIARLTGLYGYASGQDTQLYILSKTGTSDWYLQQTLQIFRPVTGGDMATTGYYILISVDQDLYLISLGSAVNPPSGNDQIIYYLNGIVINTNGAPYVGQITFGSDTITTDSTGKFVVIVEPGTTYTITAGTTTTQYTATNVQYQTVAIKIQPDPYATNIDYAAEWNSTTQAIDMTYTDQTGRTNSVTWKIRNTATNDVVFQQTTTSGQTISYPLPAEQQYTNYQISMTADRTTTAGLTSPVQNTWLITPSGSSPISIPGLDDTGKNILFCAVLMIFGALFGVVHSTKGAVAVSFLAAALRYFELITIPWILIIVAATIAIIAALARGGGNN